MWAGWNQPFSHGLVKAQEVVGNLPGFLQGQEEGIPKTLGSESDLEIEISAYRGPAPRM